MTTTRNDRRIVVHVRIAGAVIAAGMLHASPLALTAHRPLAPPDNSARRIATFARRPMSFESPGRGREDLFIARGRGYSVLLTPAEAIVNLAQSGVRAARVRMALAGARPTAAAAGIDPLPGKVNYLLGNDPSRWRVNLPTFRQVKYNGVYPGIDVVYYGTQQQLEYDFLLAPGADPLLIRLTFAGHDSIALDGAGDIVLRTSADDVRFARPVAYQGPDENRRRVSADYVLLDDGDVGFRVGAYDARKPLVIDPVLDYATYLGGTESESAETIAVDAAGNIYVAGETTSADFPIASALQPAFASASAVDADAFLTKIDATGTSLLYSTYLGGTLRDAASAMALDASGQVYLTGSTRSANFPLAGPAQPALGGADDVFVAKLNASGSALVYSTFVGGGGGDNGNAIAVDGAGSAVVTGRTTSRNFPTVNAIQPSYGGDFQDGFAFKLDVTGSALLYSTYLGGRSIDHGNDVAVDVAGNAYVVGQTLSVDFPTLNSLQPLALGDGFVVKLNPLGALIYSTYLGGSSWDGLARIALDAATNVYVVGSTWSKDLPLVNPLQAIHGSASFTSDAFVAVLNAAGSALIFSTYLGGNLDDEPRGLALDAAGRLYVVGTTWSSDFPTVNPIQPRARDTDAFVAKIDPIISSLVYSTPLGGEGVDAATDVALDDTGNAYIALMSQSAYFPTANPLQPALLGNQDGVIARITEVPAPGIGAISPALTTRGTSVPVVLSGQNFVNGSTAVAVSGSGITAGPIDVTSPTSLTTTLTIAGDAPLDVRDVTVTTPQGTSNRVTLTIVHGTPGCRVSLPVSMYGDVLDAQARVGIGSDEQVSGVWALGLLIYDNGEIRIHGQGIYQGTIAPVNPPFNTYFKFNTWFPQGPPPILGVVSAFFTPDASNLCAHNVAFTPGVTPAVARNARTAVDRILAKWIRRTS